MILLDSWSLSLLTHFPPILFRLLLVCFLPYYSFLLFFNSFPQPANQNLKLKLMKLKCSSQFLDLFSVSSLLLMIIWDLVFTCNCYGNLFLELGSPISNFLFYFFGWGSIIDIFNLTSLKLNSWSFFPNLFPLFILIYFPS